MCGIVGYVGPRSAVELVVDGLRRLEYRGYDSAGVAVIDAGGRLHVRRAAGRIADLDAVLRARPLAGSPGIGHTRWATHGRPSEENAHPHTDCTGGLVVVHNGILENYLEVKARLAAAGHVFRSETDTEVLAHLIEHHLPAAGSVERALTRALGEFRGAWAVAVVATAAPDRVVTAKQGAGSVVVGCGRGEMFLASDMPAILPHTRDMVVLEDGDVAVITAAGVEVTTTAGAAVARPVTRVLWDPIQAERGGYRHFMLKEIHEQPRALADTFRGRFALEAGTVTLPETNLEAARVRELRRVLFVACGTAYHAGLLGRSLVERLAGLPAEADLASEFRYREGLVGPDTLVVAVSQSGETADTLGAVRVARERGCPVLAVTNAVGSALARESTGVIAMHAGPEISVASTKAFTAMHVVHYLLALWLGAGRGTLRAADVQKRLQDLVELPRLVERALELEPAVAALARSLAGAPGALFLGRGLQYPIALEAALKLKEIAYVHAEGYAGGEMKHGPIALVSDGLPVVALAPRDGSYDRMLGNIEEARARDGRIVAVVEDGDATVAARAHDVLAVPAAPDLLAPVVTIVPLQLLAYHIAVRRGLDVDQPRNLAKSVTVE